MENPVINTPTVSRLRKSLGGNSLHRRSLIKTHVVNQNVTEEINDDEAERSSLVASERAVATSTPLVGTTRRESISGSPQKEHVTGCLKLYAENKITKDNAWNLQLIDFMSSMLRRHDARMENLQQASTVVDASAKIYSFRVDGIHHDVLKMAGGLTKVAQSKRGKKADDKDDEDVPDAEGPTQVKKKKKKTKGAIVQLANADTLNGDFDTNDFMDAFFERLAATPGDVTASNRAFNVNLPINDKDLALILQTYDKFLSPINEEESEKLNSGRTMTIMKKLLAEIKATDHICEPFTGFSISNWDPETEDTGTDRMAQWVDDNRLNLSQQALAFDVNAEVEPIPVDDLDHDLLADEPLAGISSDEEADMCMAACVARLPPPPARRTDMRPHTSADTRLEYSYSAAIVAAWAGPSHWRLKNNRASKLSHGERSQSTAAVGGKQARTKRQLDFLGAGLAYDHKVPGFEYEATIPSKITISRKTLATGNTWREANFRTPIDRGLDEMHFRKLYLRQNVMMMKKSELERNKEKKEDSVHVTEAQAHVYDLDNENDMSYCTNNQENDWGTDTNPPPEPGHVTAHSGELGDMIEPPTKVPKTFIPYAIRSKTVDMKMVKNCSWLILTDKAKPEEEIVPTNFSTIYSKLTTTLPPHMRESISVPIALLSILHLANEKGLILDKQTDLKDFKIIGIDKDKDETT